MAIVVSRTEAGLSATTSFQAMDNLAGATVSSSFTVPSNVSSIKQISFAVSTDGNDDFAPLLKISGNAMRDGDAVFCGAAISPVGTSTGAVSNMQTYDTDLAVQPGNSVELSVAVTTAATIDAAASITFA
jgi:hypothetical protein